MSRRQVDAEIKSDPVDIILERETWVNDGAGGQKPGPSTPLKKQEVLIAPAKRRLSSMIVNTELGQVIDYPYIVLGRYNLDIKRGDTFVWQGDTFEVQSLHIKDEVSKVAQVDYFGGTTNG